jgi:AraC family transcriptional regulator
VRSRVLLKMPELTLGDFACASGDRAWDEVNDIGAMPHVVFPRTHVLIAQDGAQPVLATPNHVVLYRPHQLYRRGLRDARGDRSLWLGVAPELFERAPSGPAVPSDARTYLLAVTLARHLQTETPDRLLAEESAMRLLAEAFGGRATRPAVRRARTERRHDELAEAAKELLSARMAERLSLASLAAALYVSPFHLARVFRARTGFSMSDYVHGLRLRAAVDQLASDPQIDLGRLAVDLGYYSASHFCDRFRAAFGRPPSAVRGAQLRTIVEAVGTGAA